jgi:hypothetical protein
MQPPANLPKRNVQLLRATIDYIDTHPEQHSQDDWVNECGTAFCYAGHAALLAGATRPGLEITRENTWYVDTRTLTSVTSRYYSDLDDEVITVSEFAEQQLGLNVNESDIMFSEGRTRAELHALVDAFCDGAWIDNNDCIWVDGEWTYVVTWLQQTVVGAPS